MLEILWLASRQPELPQLVADVTHPTLANLRAAGMAEMQAYRGEPSSQKSSNAGEDAPLYELLERTQERMDVKN